MEVKVDFINFENKKSKYSISKLTSTDADIKEMTSQIDRDIAKYLISLYNGKEPSDEVLENLLIIWAKAKYALYVLFGRKMCYTFPCKRLVEETDFMKSIKNICDNPFVKRNRNGEEVLVDTSHFKYYFPIIMLFDEEDIKANVCPDNKNISDLIDSYKPGMKLSRFFSKFFEDEEFDIEYSKITQNKDEKIFCSLSIDFNDFLSSSINKNNWSTCFSPGGCHSSSITDITFDEVTVVGFYSNKMMQCQNKYWNSKTLRCFVHIDKQTCSFGISRAYPNNNNTNFYDNIKEGMEEIISAYFKTDETWKVCTVTPIVDGNSCNETYRMSEDNLHRIHKDERLQYVDTKSKQYFLDPIKYFCSLEGFIKKKLLIGTAKPVCMNCGQVQDGKLKHRLMCKGCAMG